jgi:hypothetical protein
VTATGTLGVMLIVRVSGQPRATTTAATSGMASTLLATPSRSTRASGVPFGTSTAACTLPATASGAPVIVTALTPSTGLKNTAYTAPQSSTPTSTRPRIQGQRRGWSRCGRSTCG